MTEQTSRLVIEISSEQAKKNAEELSKELVKIFTGGEKANDSTSKLGKTIQVTSNITQNFNTTVNNTTKAVEKQTQELAKQEKQVDKTGVAIKTLAGHLAAFITINSTIDKMDSYTGLQNRLKLVTNSQTELNRAMNDTFAIAQNTRQSWDSTAQIYQTFANNAKTLGLSMSQTAQLTETVSKAVAISGSSAASSEAALIQMSQAISAGVLRGEELNSVMEQTPGLAKAIAEGMGITVGQLRSVAATGSITSAELVKALTKAKASVDNLFSKTDITIGQSITLLNNELGKFVGEAGQSSGAAKTLAEAIQLLSQNLGPLADGAMVVGIGYLTKSFLDKAVATRTAIAASVQHQTSMLAEQAATVELTGVEALRARQNVVLAAQEVRSAELALVNAKSKDAQALATQRLAAAEVAHNVALKESTIATAQYTLAQDALNKSKALGSKLLTAIGGPIGALTLAAMGLAAGYTYLQKRADEANKKLEEQAAVAKRAKDELLALQGLEKDDAINKMTAAFKLQNEALTESSSKLNMQLNAIEQLYKGNKDVVKVVQDARNGTISMTDAVAKFNQLRISKEIYNSVKANTTEFVKNATEATNTKNKLNLFGFEVELAGRKAQTAKNGIDANTEALDKNASAAAKAATKLDAYIKSLNEQDYSNGLMVGYLNKGYSKEQAEALSKAWSEALATDSIVTKEQEQRILKSVALEKQKSDLVNERNQKEKENTKELDKQLKVLQVNEKVKANAAKYGFENIESKYGILPGLLSGIHMQESRGNANAIGPMTKYGTAKGGFQFLDDTAKRFKLTGSDVFDLGKSAEAAAKYLQILYQKFGSWDKAISAYHAGEGNVEKGTKIGPVNRQYVLNVKGYIAGANGFDGSTKEFDSSVNDLVKFLQVKQDIELQYSSGEIQRKTEHEKKLADIQSHFSGDAYTKLERQENERFANENRLAELQFDLNVRGWNWTYEQRIQNEIDTQKVTISLNKEYSDIQKQIAKEEVDEKFAYELKKFRETQLLKQLEYSTQYTERVNTARDRIAQYSLNPFDYQKTALASSQSQAYASNDKAYFDDIAKVEADYQNKQISQEQHFQKMLDAQRLYKENEYAISLEYKRKEEDLAKFQQQNQLQIWSGLVSSSQTMWSQLTQSVKDASGEQSASYKTMFAMQQAFSIASTLIATHLAAMQVTADGANPTLFGKVTAHSAILAMGYAQAGLIASQAIAGFATGGLFTGSGQVRGAGTETSDSINAKLSDYEFVTRAWAVKRIGVENMNYMNRTGEMPYQREYEALKMQFLMPNKSEIVPSLKDGGLVGVSRMSNAVVERRQFDSIQQNNSGSSAPTVNIYNNVSDKVGATTSWDGKELTVIIEDLKKQNEATMDRKIAQSWRDAERQGGALDRIKKGR
ncbi:tape measure domain-containing protein [Acinetobacter bereziniae]|uniref:tape measure protein n=2 Tax=Acinetobacter bereziniae TaxID=106648 RepID=UPI00285E5EE7|nr:tape measure protein [Acinetobacter bereziniae]MDR6542979.1 tape measure domain-containing protein [Acinetobacter bereziniae]